MKIRYLFMLFVFVLLLGGLIQFNTPKNKTQYIEPLKLYFNTKANDSTVVISFYRNGANIYSNHIETRKTSDIRGLTLYFFVDNTEGKHLIDKLIVPDNVYYEYSITGIKTSVIVSTLEPPDMINHLNNFIENAPKTVKMSINSKYMVEVYVVPYNKGVNYRIYDMKNHNIDSLLKRIEFHEHYLSYEQIKELKIDLDYERNVLSYGLPQKAEKHILTNKNKRDYFLKGWLFLDRLDLVSPRILENCIWNLDEAYNLSVIYLIDDTGERSAVSSAYYVNYIPQINTNIYQ